MFRVFSRLPRIPSLGQSGIMGTLLSPAVKPIFAAVSAFCVVGAFGLLGTRAVSEEIGVPCKQLINDPNDTVRESIDGFIKTHPAIGRLDGFDQDIKVLVRKDWNKNNVALISGGGSGHEPAHAGYLGCGMLTAVVCGNVFASPSAEAVLAAIRHVSYPKGPGVLLIVKNYTGDRINFGIAAEQAKAEGIKVNMVVVADDCALPSQKGITGGRGIAGTVFVHKVAGAVAESGGSLEEVTNLARLAAGNTRSVGVSLSACTAPGQNFVQRLSVDEMELGLGIHGEPGAFRLPIENVDSMVDRVLAHLTSANTTHSTLHLHRGDKVALMVNNLGTATPMEMSVVANRAVDKLQDMGVKVSQVYVGSFMTALDMKGFSLSVIREEPKAGLLAMLAMHTTAPAWINVTPCTSTTTIFPLHPSMTKQVTYSPPDQLTAEGQKNLAVINSVSKALIAAEPSLTRWDLAVGDGDCGFTFKDVAERMLSDSANYPLNDLIQTIAALTVSAKTMGGTSGALYRIMLTTAHGHLAQTFAQTGSVAPTDYADALAAGVEAISKYGGAKVGYRTMLDTLVPFVVTLSHEIKTGTVPLQALEVAVEKAEAGAESTVGMKALAGRSNYVPDHLLHANPDPGAKAAAVWLRAIYTALKDSQY